MKNPLQPSEHIARYRSGLLATDKFSPEVQLALKRRAFETFDTLLKHHDLLGLEPGRKLLDLGTAGGAFVEVCRQAGLEAKGLDITDGVNFECDPLPEPNGAYDLVTAISLIEHLHAPGKMLNEVRRVLRSGGAFILVSPNLRYTGAGFYDDPTHVHPYTEKSLERILGDYGFKEVRVVPWLVKKPAWLWDMPKAFFVARWLIPFRGDASALIPGLLKGRSGAMLALARKPEAK